MSTDATTLRACPSEPEADICVSGVNQKADHVAYWLRYENRILAYLITRPIRINDLCGNEAVRGWVAPELRGKGIFQDLIDDASRDGLLISDLEGMTCAAHMAWLNARGFSKTYINRWNGTATEAKLPVDGRYFSDASEAASWLMVLKKMPSEA